MAVRNKWSMNTILLICFIVCVLAAGLFSDLKFNGLSFSFGLIAFGCFMVMGTSVDKNKDG